MARKEAGNKMARSSKELFLGFIVGILLALLSPVTAYEDAQISPGRHPHVRAAIRELQAAREEILSAREDFGGHKVSAIKAIDEAQEGLKKIIKHSR